jgi:hypothetical protein
MFAISLKDYVCKWKKKYLLQYKTFKTISKINYIHYMHIFIERLVFIECIINLKKFGVIFYN